VRENISFINGVNLKSKSSWEELYSYFYAALCNYSSKITKDKHASEDIVQNMFIKLWDSRIVFNDLSGLTAYLYKAVYSRSLNFLRDNKKSLPVDQEAVKSESSLEERYIEMALEEEIISQFYKALEEMSPQQREIILMTLRGDKVDDISRKLNISPNSVKTQKKRAYTFLRGKLGSSFMIVKLLLFA
jgi:RNA polymerase sigma-70 factor (ECF subfamily)